MRTSTIKRNTEETKIELSLNLDGKGESKINTGCGFFDHMLTLFSKHSKIDLAVTCKGDINVDYHHTVEDVGIVLGKALLEALGDKSQSIKDKYEIFNPNVSSYINELYIKNFYVNGEKVENMKEYVKEIVFDDIYSDGDSSGKGEIRRIIEL